ncbi:unnamed protein product, partial [Medioppia subpectinata]
MTTLSLLKNKEEFGSLKIKPLFCQKPDFNSHHKWLLNELIQWSKGFADHNQQDMEMCAKFMCYMYSGCQQKDRLLAMTKWGCFTKTIDEYTEPSRKERSAPLMVELIEKLLTTLLTGRSDPKFLLGRRLLDSLEALDVFMTRDQKTKMRDSLKETFESTAKIHCDYWLQNRFIPYDEYYELRSKEAFWPVFHLMAEISVDYTPPEPVLRYIPVNKLLTSAVRLSLAVNDYMMFVPKMAVNDITSGVMSYAWTKKCTIQTAIDSQYELIKDLQIECRSLSRTIADKLDPDFQTPALLAYVNAVIDISNGFYSTVSEIFKWEEKDGLIVCHKWDQLRQQLLDSNNKYEYWGSSSGIGAAIAIKLWSLGANVVITGRNEKRIQEVVNKCQNRDNQRALGMRADLLVDKDIEQLVAKIIKEFGKIDILVNNAGIGTTVQ